VRRMGLFAFWIMIAFGIGMVVGSYMTDRPSKK
jgi:predicted MFS family arabinose efflux permease